jgi:exosortase A-associated hydrolase 2
VKEQKTIESFYLPGAKGKLFSLFYPPLGDDACNGGVLYIHPFAEEMNKSRRMAALQAREFSRLGYAVLVIDLYGCGDSDGELKDADWDIWVNDLLSAMEWLQSRCNASIILWGLRLGASIALQISEQSALNISKLILWHPILKGSVALTEFLRIAFAADMLKSRQNTSSTSELKKKLLSGQTLELSGYDLNSGLAKAMDSVDMALYSKTETPVFWLEVVRDTTRPVSPAVSKILDVWKTNNISVNHVQLSCESFWSSGEITECADLICATTEILAK